jgi:drug/metabolite transporter (DMT)-like permease
VLKGLELKPPGWLALCIALVAVSWASILARLADVHGLVATWWRLLVGSAITALVYAVAPREERKPHGWLLPCLAGLALSIHFASWLESLNHTSVAVSTAIVSTYPVYTVVLDKLMGKQVRALRLLGVLLAVAGVLLLSRPWATELGSLYGPLLALVGAVSGAAYFGIGRLARSHGYPLIPYTLRTYTVALLASTLYSIALSINPLSVPARSVPFLILLGLVPMLLGHTMANYALRFYTATLVTSVLLLEPFGAAALAVVVLSEVPSLYTLAAMAVTVTGTLLVAYTEDR